jgi:gliding motility-associated lipoprotein GldH
MRIKASIVALFIGSLSFVACDKIPMYQKSYSFENKEWVQNVKPSFTIEIKDTVKVYDFVLTLRTSTDYKYSNLWIFMNTAAPDGKKSREAFEIQITNPDGTWCGKKTGTIVENNLIFKKKKIPLKGKYVFVLEQGITASKIDQVLDVGLTVDESK